MITRDELWKGIIEDLFEEFLFFFFPNLAKRVDFSKPFEFLDKDLNKIYPENEKIKRYADKLVKVFLLDGTFEWVLVHIEVQGYWDKTFGWRMFKMFYRLIDRFSVPINQIAIFTDDYPTYHPKGLSYKTEGSWFDYGFKTWKLLEHPPHTLKNRNNLFAIVMEVAWYGLDSNKENDEQVYGFKTRLVRELLSRNVSKQKIKSLLNFIEHYVNFEDKDFFTKFEDHLYKNKEKMGLEEIIKEAYRKEGRKEGEEIGEKKGIQKGIQKGKEEGQEDVFYMLFDNGFTLEQVNKMTKFDLKKLKTIHEKWKKQQKKK